jgi:hypothetical protein
MMQALRTRYQHHRCGAGGDPLRRDVEALVRALRVYEALVEEVAGGLPVCTEKACPSI